MKNIHLLSTDKPSRLHYYNHIDSLGLSKEYLKWKQGRNIYITSEEEIKEGDWTVFISTNEITKVPLGGFKGKVCQKIILTTDQELIADGIEQISEDVLLKIVEHINSGKNIESFDEL